MIRLLLVLLVGLMCVPGCWEVDLSANDRAAEENRAQVGRQDRGQGTGDWARVPTGEGEDASAWEYLLAYDSVVLSPNGQWVFSGVPVPGPGLGYDAPGLMLCAKHLETGQQRCMPELMDIKRIGFSQSGDWAFVLSKGGCELHELNLNHLDPQLDMPVVTQSHPLVGGCADAIDVSMDGRFVVTSNVPTSDITEAFWHLLGCVGSRCNLSIIDRDAETMHAVTMPHPPRDIDFSPFRNELIITSSTHLEDGAPEAYLDFVALETAAIIDTVSFPNCADELVLQPGGHLGLMAPVSCQHGGPTLNLGRRGKETGVAECSMGSGAFDPISVLDLDERQFITNLPGYGPVDISPDGKTAIGFTRKHDMEIFWDFIQEEPVGLITVDLTTLDWNVIEYGNREPAYWIAPDAVSVYTYEDGLVCDDNDDDPCTLGDNCEPIPSHAAHISLLTGVKTPLSDDSIHLKNFVVTTDGLNIIALQSDRVVQLATGATHVSTVVLDFDGHNRMAVRPQNDYLLVGKQHVASYDLVGLEDYQHFFTSGFSPIEANDSSTP